MRSGAARSICEATVKVRVGDEHAHTVAEGDGPVNALDGALRRAGEVYPESSDRPADRLQSPHRQLRDRHRARRACSSSRPTAVEWTTIGVNQNIIEASLQALVDSLEYGLKRKEFAAHVAGRAAL